MEDIFKAGEIVQLSTDNSKGIVVSQTPSYVNVLFKGFHTAPVKREHVYRTGKKSDLTKLWDLIEKEVAING